MQPQNAMRAYKTVQSASGDPREIEALALLNAASKLQAQIDSLNKDNQALQDAIGFNRQLWSVLTAEIGSKESHLPKNIRDNLLAIALFVLTESVKLRFDPAKDGVQALIDVNINLAKGLRGVVTEATGVA